MVKSTHTTYRFLTSLPVVMQAKGLIRAIDDVSVRALRREKHILFNGINEMNFIAFKPIYERLKDDKNIRLYFMNALNDINFYKQFNIQDARFVTRKEARFKKWNLYIATDYIEPWLSRKTKRMFIPHGMADKKVSDGAHPFMVREELLRYDTVFFASPVQYQQFGQRYKKRADDIAILNGYHRLDALTNPICEKAALKKTLGIADNLPIILLAPTWGDKGIMSKCGMQLIEGLLAFKANILLKLHDNTYSGAFSKNKLNWHELLGKFSGQENIFIIKDKDPYPYLLLCDALISDYGSLLLEYQALQKPAVFFSIDEHQRTVVNDHEKLGLLKKACITIESLNDLGAAFTKLQDNAYANNAYKEQIRQKYFINFGQATDKIVKAVYTLIGMDKT